MSEADARAKATSKLSPEARRLAEQWAKLGGRWAREGRLARPADRPSPPTSAAESRKTPAGGYGELALKLAEVLDDHGSLRMYEKLVQQCEEGRLCPAQGRGYVRRLLTGKARELARLRYPAGPMRNPAAVFVAWVRKLPVATTPPNA
ncbi:hypothetical protein ACERK3_01035 [Phycisphaerales bacterium AB-hyl4]|uniref:Uncharacterized protein n=1 Tax=Natronomicrosphaera hydrolytica TaxID=3242702 RepID=A0ABV4TZU5_9BACT